MYVHENGVIMVFRGLGNHIYGPLSIWGCFQFCLAVLQHGNDNHPVNLNIIHHQDGFSGKICRKGLGCFFNIWGFLGILARAWGKPCVKIKS